MRLLLKQILTCLAKNPPPTEDFTESAVDEIVVRSALARTTCSPDVLFDRKAVQRIAKLARLHMDAPGERTWGRLCDSIDARSSDVPTIATAVIDSLFCRAPRVLATVRGLYEPPVSP